MQPFARAKHLRIAPRLFLVGLVLISSACSSMEPSPLGADVIAGGESQFCAVARDKAAYLGKELVLRGSYITDLRHYSLLKATCDGEEAGFSLGFGPPQISLSDPRVRKKCEVACHIVVDAVVTGKLIERDGGIYLDFSEMILPDGLER